jgi:peptidoglycan/LPS O-acetylase OafA/YrhL
MRLTFQSTVARSSQYRADIDGLRAVAVLSVLFFHTKIPGFPGGFVGVDVFFVISGYLITSIIAKDMFQEKFSFLAFYERRMRRIFPAIFFLLFSCTLIAAVLLAPSDFVVFARTMIAATCFLSNFYFLSHAKAGGYFANLSDLQPLLHTWSLAVEEQFYLLFPAVLLILIKWAKQRAAQFLFLLALASFLFSVWLTPRNQSASFYMLLPRSWELLMGSLLAMKAVPPISPRWLREIAGTSGLVLIICADVFYTNQTPFPGLSALPPCVGAWLVIYAGEQGSSWANTVLTFPPLVFIGVISYSLYLWHWPLIVFSQYFLLGDLSRSATIAVLAGSVLMAFISFEFVESRFRGRNAVFSRGQIFSLGFAATGASLILGAIVLRTDGVPQRYDASIRNIVIENASRRYDFEKTCANWKTNPRSLADINFCNFGPGASRKILFWGDSHVQQLYPVVRHLYQSGALRDRGVVFAIANSCPPFQHMNDPRAGFHCDAFANLLMQRSEMNDIDTVFMGFSTWWAYIQDGICPWENGKCVSGTAPEAIRRVSLSELSGQIQRLRRDGKTVIICLPFPIYDQAIPYLEIRNAVFSRFGFTRTANDSTSPAFRQQILETSLAAGAEIFDPRQSLCTNGACITQINCVSIYIDNNHIAASQIGILEDNLRQVLQNEPIPRPNRRGFQLAERANQRSLPEGSWPRKQRAN